VTAGTITLEIAQSASSSSVATVDADRLTAADATDLPSELRGRWHRAAPGLTDPAQAYFWSPDWQAAERASEQDLREGRFEEFERVEDAIRWLLSDY
jgi:hypothetical protein